MLANDGTVFARYGDLYGDHVTLDDVPKYLPEAILAIEDRRFYHHFGIDPWGLLRAAVRNFMAAMFARVEVRGWMPFWIA